MNIFICDVKVEGNSLVMCSWREPSFFVMCAAQVVGVLIDPCVFIHFCVFFVRVCQHVQLPPM
jgi:hypothetical protein